MIYCPTHSTWFCLGCVWSKLNIHTSGTPKTSVASIRREPPKSSLAAKLVFAIAIIRTPEVTMSCHNSTLQDRDGRGLINQSAQPPLLVSLHSLHTRYEITTDKLQSVLMANAKHPATISVRCSLVSKPVLVRSLSPP